MPVYSSTALPRRADMWHDEATVTAGNALANVVDTSQQYNMYANQSAAANGDQFTSSFWVAAGTYTLAALGITSTDRGKIDWYIDGVLVVSGQDWYSASTTRNVVKTQGAIVISADGYHVLKGVVNGKNASSSAYVMALTKYWLYQASD